MSDFTEPEPMNPFDEALSAARAEGYRKALDDVFDAWFGTYHKDETPWAGELEHILDQLKRAYEKGSDGNGKATE